MDDLRRNLADNVRRLREAHKMSQQRMADLSGLPRPTWASLESGAANPTLNVLSKAAQALQVSIEELVGTPRNEIVQVLDLVPWPAIRCPAHRPLFPDTDQLVAKHTTEIPTDFLCVSGFR